LTYKNLSILRHSKLPGNVNRFVVLLRCQFWGIYIMVRKLTFVDVFAGCGGLSLGLMQAGWKGLFAIEHDPNAFHTLSHNLLKANAPMRFNWPTWLPKGPLGISEVLNNSMRPYLHELAGKVDMLVGGPPCQGFSSAGKRNPSDPRNKLVEDYLRLVKILKPKAVLIENVRGITTDFDDEDSPNGRINYAKWITKVLGEDYKVSSRVVDTSMFGVPQKRHRFFVIAFRQDMVAVDPTPFDRIERNLHSFLKLKGINRVPVSTKMAISDLEIARNSRVQSKDTRGFEEISYNGPITNYQTIMNMGLIRPLSDTRLARHKPEIVKRFTQIIKLCHKDGRLNVSLSPELRASFDLKKRAIRVMDPDQPSPTITSMPDDLIHYSEPRALTVRENARLQSFPDWFEFKGKYTTGGDRRKKEVPRFTQVANAVPPLAAEAIGLTIAEILKEIKPAKFPNLLKVGQKILESQEAQL